jgi:predicted phage terminase large subunit-like protein
MLLVVDARAGRWDSKSIIEEMMSIQERYKPELFVAEKGVIEKAIGPFLQDEMFKRGQFINLHLETPINDKRSRARSIQGRMRAGGVKFDKEASWYPDFEQEMLRFDRDDKDDYVDSIAWLGLIINKMFAGASSAELAEDAYEEELLKDPEAFFSNGRDMITGY